ncbi:bacillithiol biosynthesis cysteine-adding enzyme BshC [Mesobacillus harenae]|uniref:bacillithiol biosynthesis cysteine-adding enzyme BshC n=1 Tax=Mesobacillus harenae TaxID=2213203 RepID=UPI001580D405|nr:bacillithiol biosynthesis cysteine-adding enzyme BshC [Mesobacillus harenae]
MEIVNLSLPAANRFATEYLASSPNVLGFFHYNYNENSQFQDRLEELGSRTFYRDELADHIDHFMTAYPTSDRVRTNIEKLRKNNSVAVIGGQQAGLLTGPLYTIHKIISILKLSELKEKELGVPVVPVFWIAGEDHDIQEVNHLFVSVNGKPVKWNYPEKIYNKQMVTDINLNKEVASKWIEDILAVYGETEYTNKLLKFLNESVELSKTFVDFFARIIMEMFKDKGLLIVDSGNRDLRRLEKNFFINQIQKSSEITRAVIDQQKETLAAGFSKAIDITDHAANLFYYDDSYNERVLLHYDPENDVYFGKNDGVRFTREELLKIASEFPERLSNNVATRPLMQEWLFPTLAFVGGPGEIAYWAELKKVFEEFNLKMPPLVPRLNLTILDRSIERDLNELELDLTEVLVNGTSKNELIYIDSLKDRELEALFEEAKDQLQQQYRAIEAKTEKLDQGLIPLLKKNESILLKQIEFMQNKADEAICSKHDHYLKKFNRIDHALRPAGAPQERVWNPFYYVNQYGFDFIQDLMDLPYQFDGTHKVIKM